MVSEGGGVPSRRSHRGHTAPRQGGPVFPSIENTMPKVAVPNVTNSETESQLLAQRVSSCAFLNGVGL